jgi:hypothetical protein
MANQAGRSQARASATEVSVGSTWTTQARDRVGALALPNPFAASKPPLTMSETGAGA